MSHLGNTRIQKYVGMTVFFLDILALFPMKNTILKATFKCLFVAWVRT